MTQVIDPQLNAIKVPEGNFTHLGNVVVTADQTRILYINVPSNQFEVHEIQIVPQREGRKPIIKFLNGGGAFQTVEETNLVLNSRFSYVIPFDEKYLGLCVNRTQPGITACKTYQVGIYEFAGNVHEPDFPDPTQIQEAIEA